MLTELGPRVQHWSGPLALCTSCVSVSILGCLLLPGDSLQACGKPRKAMYYIYSLVCIHCFSPPVSYCACRGLEDLEDAVHAAHPKHSSSIPSEYASEWQGKPYYYIIPKRVKACRFQACPRDSKRRGSGGLEKKLLCDRQPETVTAVGTVENDI